MTFLHTIDHRIRTIALVSLCAGIAMLALIYAGAKAAGVEPVSVTGDSRGYILLAQNLLQHGVFSLSHHAPFVPESFRAPGYPFFLAALLVVVQSTTAALVIQTILLAVAPVLLYILIRPLGERGAFWSAIVFALEPVRLFYSASLLSDTLFMCALLLSLIVLLKAVERSSWQLYALCGALCGAGVLMRPIAILLPVIYALYALYSIRSHRSVVAVLLAAALLVALPWSLRNHALFGSWNISSVGTANLVLYNAPEFVAFTDDAHGREILAEFKAKQAALPPEEQLSLARSGLFVSTFFAVINGHELSYALFHIYKTIPFFLTDGLRDILRLFNVDIGGLPNLSSALARGNLRVITDYILRGGVGIMLFGVGVLFWTCASVLSAWHLWRAVRGRAPRVWILFAAVVLYFALLTGPVSNARYRLPVEGLLIAAACCFVTQKLYTKVHA